VIGRVGSYGAHFPQNGERQMKVKWLAGQHVWAAMAHFFQETSTAREA